MGCQNWIGFGEMEVQFNFKKISNELTNQNFCLVSYGNKSTEMGYHPNLNHVWLPKKWNGITQAVKPWMLAGSHTCWCPWPAKHGQPHILLNAVWCTRDITVWPPLSGMEHIHQRLGRWHLVSGGDGGQGPCSGSTVDSNGGQNRQWRPSASGGGGQGCPVSREPMVVVAFEVWVPQTRFCKIQRAMTLLGETSPHPVMFQYRGKWTQFQFQIPTASKHLIFGRHNSSSQFHSSVLTSNWGVSYFPLSE